MTKAEAIARLEALAARERARTAAARAVSLERRKAARFRLALEVRRREGSARAIARDLSAAGWKVSREWVAKVKREWGGGPVDTTKPFARQHLGAMVTINAHARECWPWLPTRLRAGAIIFGPDETALRVNADGTVRQLEPPGHPHAGAASDPQNRRRDG